MAKASDALPAQRGIERYFMVQKFCFTAIGVDPTSLEQTVFNRFLAWIPMFAMLILCGPIIMLAAQYTNDLYLMMNTVAPFWQSVLALTKFNLFMWNKKKIVGMVRTMWLFNLKANEEELKILVDENYYDKTISLFYYATAGTSAVLISILPFLTAAVYAWKGASYFESLDQPFKAVYYWDQHASIQAFTFNYVWNLISVYFVLNASLGFDSLFSWFMRNISAQFRILNLRIKQSAEQAKCLLAKGNQANVEIAKSIVACVHYHRQVLKLAENFDEVYKPLVFVKLLVGCVQIACVTFQFSGGGDITVLVFNISFTVTVATQLMLYCHGGQKVTDLSISVGSTIYESFEWYNLNSKSKKLLLLPMMRSEKPCNITGIFFELSLSLFLWVYRAAGSFLTMMMSMEEVK